MPTYEESLKTYMESIKQQKLKLEETTKVLEDAFAYVTKILADRSHKITDDDIKLIKCFVTMPEMFKNYNGDMIRNLLTRSPHFLTWPGKKDY